jgi:hypothetical protein
VLIRTSRRRPRACRDPVGLLAWRRRPRRPPRLDRRAPLELNAKCYKERSRKGRGGGGRGCQQERRQRTPPRPIADTWLASTRCLPRPRCRGKEQRGREIEEGAEWKWGYRTADQVDQRRRSRNTAHLASLWACCSRRRRRRHRRKIVRGC